MDDIYALARKVGVMLLRVLKLGQAAHGSVAEEVDFLEQVRRAHREWQIAVNNFNYASDPDLVDFNIYNIEAAEKKYIYYIKLARRENIAAAPEIYDEIGCSGSQRSVDM